MGSDTTTEEVVKEIEVRRASVLQKFSNFEEKAIEKRRFLLQTGQLQHFLRSSGEFKQVVESLIEIAENVEICRDSEHLARAQKTLNRLKSEIDGKRHNLPRLEGETAHLLDYGHYGGEQIQKTYSEIRDRWEYLLKLVDLKWLHAEKESDSIDFEKKCSKIMNWMAEKRAANSEPDQKLFDEIRKFSVHWEDICSIYQQFSDPSPKDSENFQKISKEWDEFQQFVNSLLKKLDDSERFQRFLENSQDIFNWIDEKEEEIRSKKMDVEESMKYRKTIEIEIKSTKKRIEGVKNPINLGENRDFNLENHVEQLENRFQKFEKFIEKWRFELENAADFDALLREAEDIQFWCSEKQEDLKVMRGSESLDSDEISTWIETNSFDLNSWDHVIEQFKKSAKKLLEKMNDEKVANLLWDVETHYDVTKKSSQDCNEYLESRIEKIAIEKLIFQTHQKAAHLVNVLRKNSGNEENLTTEHIEKELRMLDGVAVRCSSAVEQIEHIEHENPQKIIGKAAREQMRELAEMKEILKNSCFSRKKTLENLLEKAYFIDSCVEIFQHSESILKAAKEHKKESIQPVKEQLEGLSGACSEMDLTQKSRKLAEEHLKRAREVLELVEKEHEKQAERSEKRKIRERIEKFVERVDTWIQENQGFQEEETDSMINGMHNQNLRRNISNCQHLLSICHSYLQTIDQKREELGDGDTDSRCLLDGIQHSLEQFQAQIHQKSSETVQLLEASERTNELNSQNDWIKMKMKELSDEPVWDSLLMAQKMNRRYEKDSEEIENRRKVINQMLKSSETEHRHPILEEIESNWNRMKEMFEERGGVLERMIKLFEYDEERRTTSEWLQEKMIYADAIEPKNDESINRVMVKKLEDLAQDVDNYEPKIVETHALLEDALITPKSKDSVSQQVIRFKTALTRKQGEIESDYVALKRLISKKTKELHNLLHDSDVIREIGEMEHWIEEQEAVLNRLLVNDSDELPEKMEHVMMNLQRRRAKLTDIKCNGANSQVGTSQKIDEAFGMLDVFSFELDRIRHKSNRANLLKKLKSEVEDVLNGIQVINDKIGSFPSIRKIKKLPETSNLDGDIETLRRRVLSVLERAKEVRAANAELAPQVYDLEEHLEKQWTELSKTAEQRRKSMEEARVLMELDSELMDMEQWIDMFNEEVILVTGEIHDALGVQVGLEAIDTWREELSNRVDQLSKVKNLVASVESERNEWLKRVGDVETDLVKGRKTIDAKQDELNELWEVLEAERDCERLLKWVNGKREEIRGIGGKETKRKRMEVEKMMVGREQEVLELRKFVKKEKKNGRKSTELEEKVERLEDEWRSLEEELNGKEQDPDESSILMVDEQFEQMQHWIQERITEPKEQDVEMKQRNLEKLQGEIQEQMGAYQDFMQNEHIDPKRVKVIRQLWSSLIETTTIRQKALENQKNRLLDILEDIGIWLNETESEVKSSVNLTKLYGTADAEKTLRRLKSLNEQAGEKDDLLRKVRKDGAIEEMVEKLREGLMRLKTLIKANYEDLEVWKSLHEVVKAIDDEICWYKEISVIVSSTDAGHDSGSLEVISRKHERIRAEAERRKQKVSKIVDRSTELMSAGRRPALDSKFEEIDRKLAQLTELLQNNQQIAEIRTQRLAKWREFFKLMDEIREKEQSLVHISELKKGSPEAILADVERKLEILETIGEQLEPMEKMAEEMSKDEIIRTKSAEKAMEKLKNDWISVSESMKSTYFELNESIEMSKFVWKCENAIQNIRDQEDKIGGVVSMKKLKNEQFEHAVYHSTLAFVDSYSRETIEKLRETAKKFDKNPEIDRKMTMVQERLSSLKRQLALLDEKIRLDEHTKKRVLMIQDEYSKKACELANWLEQAEEDVSDVVGFQTKKSSEDCRQTLLEILDFLRNEKMEVLGELELLEVELSELNEDVNAFTWYSYSNLSNRIERLHQTIADRVRIVDKEIDRHVENEKICENAAQILNKCKMVIVGARKELEEVNQLKLDDQKEVLTELIQKVQGNGMIQELEKLRSLMGSRYIFDNKYSSSTPHAVLVDTCHCLELMSSMLRSVEQSIAERNSSGVTEKQLKEFQLAFQYFDTEKKGWLDYEHFELCIKSQGYDFTIESATSETMSLLDPTKSGRIQKSDYMRWMVKNETTNILDDHSAIENALKTLDARKISDSMTRKEAEFFMRKIAKHTETFTEHVHLEYKDFVDSFY